MSEDTPDEAAIRARFDETATELDGFTRTRLEAFARGIPGRRRSPWRWPAVAAGLAVAIIALVVALWPGGGEPSRQPALVTPSTDTLGEAGVAQADAGPNGPSNEALERPTDPLGEDPLFAGETGALGELQLGLGGLDLLDGPGEDLDPEDRAAWEHVAERLLDTRGS